MNFRGGRGGYNRGGFRGGYNQGRGRGGGRHQGKFPGQGYGGSNQNFKIVICKFN